MSRSFSIFVLVIGTCVAYPVCVRADVQPSEEMKQVMLAQAARAQRGEQSLDEFRSELQRPAEAGDPVAQFMLATLLLKDDQTRAIKLLRNSAEKGCAGAAGALALFLFGQNDSDGGRWLKIAIDGGDAAAMMMKSLFYYRGERGYGKSISDASAWAQLAKARSYNRGLSFGLEQFVEKLRMEMSDQQISSATLLLITLETKYPKRAFYLCGQSTP